MRKIATVVAISLALLSNSTSSFAQSTTQSVPSVSTEEYNALKLQLEALNKRLQSLEKQPVRLPSPPAAVDSSGSTGAFSREASAATTIGRLAQQVDGLKQAVEESRGGTQNFLVVGSASSGLTMPDNGASSFGATFSPIMLWTLNKNLFFESEIEFELEDSSTSTKLEYAQLSYFVNDYLTVGVGKFLDPMNIFVERYEPKWINKLPDTPLAIYDGILPESVVGAQLRGSTPIGSTKLLYALYAGNGPSLKTDSADEAGQLEFDNFTDNNNGKSAGGRLGFMPFKRLEVGYGFQYADVGTSHTPYSGASAYLQSFDADYSYEGSDIGGRINTRGQFATSSVTRETYDSDGSQGFGPLSYGNKRSGGYGQISYRPTKARSLTLRSFEFVTRFDSSRSPSAAPSSYDENRITFGIDYWLRANTVLKIAYEIDHRNRDSDNNMFLAQVATGLF